MIRSLLESVRALGTAWSRRDMTTLRSMLAPEYVHTDFTGRVFGREEWLEYAEGQTHGSTIAFRDLAAIEYDSIGIVTGANDIEGGSMGATALRFTQVWVHRDGEWRRVAFQATPIAAD